MESTQDPLLYLPPVTSAPKALATAKPQNVDLESNFFRCVKWCPDGTAMLAQCEDRSFQTLKLPTELCENTVLQLELGPRFPQAAPILDLVWYPGADSAQPFSYCFLASIRECPMKLLDASDGRLRASYKIVDHREKHVAPHSIAFNCTATHVYCGHENAIEAFDFQQPGDGWRIYTTPSKKSKDGMKGIVSSISFCPDYSGMYAAGSLSSAITLFSETTGEDPVAYLDGMTSAVMQVRFDSARPHLLYASQRRSDEILCWDMREPSEVLRRFTRPNHRTNQKLLFDLDPTGKWLVSGDEDGFINFFDLEYNSPEPGIRFRGHTDSIGSVAFNPISRTLLSVSGSRHFSYSSFSCSDPHESEDDPSSSTESEQSEQMGEDQICRRYIANVPYVKDASAKLWKFEMD